MATKTFKKKSDADMTILVKSYFPIVTSARWTVDGALIVESPEELKTEEMADIREMVTTGKAWEWI